MRPPNRVDAIANRGGRDGSPDHLQTYPAPGACICLP